MGACIDHLLVHICIPNFPAKSLNILCRPGPHSTNNTMWDGKAMQALVDSNNWSTAEVQARIIGHGVGVLRRRESSFDVYDFYEVVQLLMC